MTTATTRPIGELLREWRERRRLSQLDLAIQTDVSTRHLSFVETGRSRPTSDMILRLTEQLDVPLRDRNALLLAGGYAPAFGQSPLDGPELSAVRGALRQVLAGHEPYPAVLLNRWWELLESNRTVALLVEGSAPWLLEPPINVLRLSLHPDGMAPRIVNLAQWRAHLLARLQRQISATADSRLADLHAELVALPGPTGQPPQRTDVVVPLQYRLGEQVLSFFSITAVIGTPLDVTIEELAIESFLPADQSTSDALRRLTSDSTST